MRQKLSRYDVLLWCGLGLVFLWLLWIFLFRESTSGDIVEISVAGERYGAYDLTVEQQIPIEIQGEITNVVTIKDGCVSMTEAHCPDHLCMKQGRISKDRESIVCLPNQLVVTVKGAEKSDFDSVAR